TTRTPLFIHAPGFSKDGAKTRQPATLTDLYPTLCELAGLPTPKQCTGRSLAAQVKNPAKVDARASLTSYVFRGTEPAHGISDTRYRYIHYPDGFEELYDLENDRNEFKNLAGDPAHAETMARMKKFVPNQIAADVGPATESPYHRSRTRRAE
ncbi:MAG: DUF4976 domain-containing protein, partial [Verrucomicrobiae bacterium]|nr:DUF4976 domain-containing protein [Verrucomicrobiae bacterium]